MLTSPQLNTRQLNSMPRELRVGIDVGGHVHAVAVGLSDGAMLEAFEVPHSDAGLEDFFGRIETHAARHGVAMAARDGQQSGLAQ